MSVSLQARLSAWIVKWRVKRRLKGVRDYRVARKILRPCEHASSAYRSTTPADFVEDQVMKQLFPLASEQIAFD